MRNIDIGISDADRENVSFLLNTLLADEHVLYIKTRNYHWNVAGMHFMSLHRFFEEHYKMLEEMIDDIAERIRALGHYALGSMKDYTKLTRLLETNHIDGEPDKMLQNLLDDHQTIIRILRKDLTTDAEKYKDFGTSDFITQIMEKHEKMAWMIRAYINN